MKITGYQLMDRLEVLKEQAQVLDNQFKAALFRFEEEEAQKPDPRELLRVYEVCEGKVALLQEAQAAYNLRVGITVLGETMSLHRAVKLMGGVNRVKNQWKTAAQQGQNTGFMHYGGPVARDKDNEYAERVVPVEECLQLAEAASKRALALKQAIRSGNAVEVELELDASVFED